MVKYLFLLIILISCFPVLGQLAGNYTVGSTSSDYSTIDDAIEAIKINDNTDTVYFNIANGIYSRIFIYDFTPTFPVFFQSETADTSDVIFYTDSNSSTIEGQNIQNTIFKDIEIINDKEYSNTIYFHSGTIQNISFIGCRISNFSYAALLIGDFVFDNCTIIGKFNLSYGSSSSIIGNTFYNDVFFQVGNIKNNIFQSDLTLMNNSGYVSVSNNEIHGITLLNCHNSNFENNNIYSCIYINSTGTTNFYYNYIYAESSVYQTDFIAIGNSFYGPITLDDNNSIYNNYFFDVLRTVGANNIVISNNNFAEDSYYQNDGCTNCIVTNNNFAEEIIGSSNTNGFSNNNYFPRGGYFEPNSTNINPMYIDSSNLISQNTQLIGKGISMPMIQFDIDSIFRRDPPTIGAHEICMSQDSLNISCGDSVSLSLCSTPPSGNFIWHPTTGLSDYSCSNPIICTNGSSWYIIEDTSQSYIDSIFIKVIPFQVEVSPDQTINCMSTAYIYASYNSTASYSWSPSTGLDSTHTRTAIAAPDQTTIYTVEASIPGCGSSQDQIQISYNELPSAIATYYIDSMTVYFTNYSQCADSFTWLFGDISASYEVHPTHTYSNEGTYIVTFIAHNSFGDDTLFFNLDLNYTSIIESQQTESVRCYPNPSTGIFNVELSNRDLNKMEVFVFNSFGSIVESKVSKNIESIKIDLSNKPKGIYYLILKSNKEIYSRKLINLGNRM